MKIFHILCLSFCSTFAFSQLMITEIMYNSPDPGQDSLEFIEFYNAGAPVDVTGYSMIGVDFDFPNLIIGTDDFLYAAIDPEVFFNTFGILSEEFGGALSNGGEDLSILDADGNEVFFVDFDDGDPWPSEDDGTDGLGATIVLCDIDNPNDGASWKASNNSTGIFFNGIEILASINTIDDPACSEPSGIIVTTNGLSFVPQDITINEGETITFTNSGGTHNVNGGQDVYPGNPESFFSGAPSADAWQYEYTFNTVGLYDYHCDLHLGAGMVGTVTVLAIPPEDIELHVTEIFYNSSITPDSLEFIEVYNAGNTSVDFNGYTLSSIAISTVLSSGVLEPGEYGVIVKETSAFSTAFPGVNILAEWGTGTLSNSGDQIILTDDNGAELLNITYDDGDGWPTMADGFGSTLITCDPTGGFTLDNVSASQYPEVSFEDNAFFASPGSKNYCTYEVAEVTTLDAFGENANSGLDVALFGTVYGINIRPGGLQFTLIDDQGDGISVFSADTDFGYEYNESDQVVLAGVIGQFNGLSQIYLEDVVYQEEGSLMSPEVVTVLSEETESQFVRLENVSMVNPAQWLANGSSFNIDVTDGTNVYDVRIDNDVQGIVGTNYPTGSFSVTGIGGQYDETSPYFDGYQILPRYLFK